MSKKNSDKGKRLTVENLEQEQAYTVRGDPPADNRNRAGGRTEKEEEETAISLCICNKSVIFCCSEDADLKLRGSVELKGATIESTIHRESVAVIMTVAIELLTYS